MPSIVCDIPRTHTLTHSEARAEFKKVKREMPGLTEAQYRREAARRLGVDYSTYLKAWKMPKAGVQAGRLRAEQQIQAWRTDLDGVQRRMMGVYDQAGNRVGYMYFDDVANRWIVIDLRGQEMARALEMNRALKAAGEKPAVPERVTAAPKAGKPSGLDIREDFGDYVQAKNPINGRITVMTPVEVDGRRVAYTFWDNPRQRWVGLDLRGNIIMSDPDFRAINERLFSRFKAAVAPKAAGAELPAPGVPGKLLLKRPGVPDLDTDDLRDLVRRIKRENRLLTDAQARHIAAQRLGVSYDEFLRVWKGAPAGATTAARTAVQPIVRAVAGVPTREQILASVKTGVRREVDLHGGAIAYKVAKVTTNDGRVLVLKVSEDTDAIAEYLASYLAERMGVRTAITTAPTRYRMPASEAHWGDMSQVWMEYVPGEMGGMIRDYDVMQRIAQSPEMMRLQWFDRMLGNYDRHGGNWFWSNGHVVGIDHGLAFTGQADSAYLPAILKAPDVKLMRAWREVLIEARPEFERYGWLHEWEDCMVRLDSMIAAPKSPTLVPVSKVRL